MPMPLVDRITAVLRQHQWSVIYGGCRCQDTEVTVNQWAAHVSERVAEALQDELGQ